VSAISGYLYVLAAMLIWGSVGVFVRFADQPAATIVFVRVAVAFIALAVYMLVTRQPVSFGRNRGRVLLSGVVLALNWLFFFKAIQTTTIGNAVLTYYLSPVFSILWARLFLGEKLEVKVIWALALAASGVGLMLSNYEFSLQSSDFIGILFGLAGALFYSMVVVMAKSITDVSSASLVLAQMGVASLIFLPIAWANPTEVGIVSLGSMFVMGLVHSALALGLYFAGLKKIKVQHASILSYVDPASALLYALIIFGEVPSMLTAIGGLCILAASYIVISVQKAQPRD
jgi:RarD protein